MNDQSPNTNPESSPKSSRGLLYGIGAIVVIGLGASVFVLKKSSEAPIAPTANPVAQVAATPTEAVAPAAAAPATGGPVDLTVDEAGLSKAVVTMETDKGTIKFKFYAKDAPNTTKRFVELIQSNFYNGLNFHRYEPGFVIQGGDPQGNGTGGSGQKLKAEFNARKHVLGTVAMARAQDPDSADSQFYIVLAPAPHLDGNYTAFGQVSEGLDVVQALRAGDKMTKVIVQ